MTAVLDQPPGRDDERGGSLGVVQDAGQGGLVVLLAQEGQIRRGLGYGALDRSRLCRQVVEHLGQPAAQVAQRGEGLRLRVEHHVGAPGEVHDMAQLEPLGARIVGLGSGDLGRALVAGEGLAGQVPRGLQRCDEAGARAPALLLHGQGELRSGRTHGVVEVDHGARRSVAQDLEGLGVRPLGRCTPCRCVRGRGVADDPPLDLREQAV